MADRLFVIVNRFFLICMFRSVAILVITCREDTFAEFTFCIGLVPVQDDQASKGHFVDALALRGDEGRSTLR